MEVSSDQIMTATIEAKIIRADGTEEDLGVLDSYKRPWWRALRDKLRRH